jgi:hypothetical protein
MPMSRAIRARTTSYKPLSGSDYLNSIPKDRANQAIAVLAGKAPYPSTARNNKFNQQILLDVRSAEPDFDATAWGRRTKMIADFTSGPTSKLIRSLNQAPLHALTLADAYDQLNNYDGSHTVNDALTNTEAAMGVKPQLAARGKFNAAQPAVADELATLYKGGPGTIPGIEDQKRAFAMGAGPTESNSALSAASELMRDRMETIQEQWKNGMGSVADMFPVISPQAKSALDKLYGRYHPDQASAPAAAPGPTVPHLRYDAKGNRI